MRRERGTAVTDKRLIEKTWPDFTPVSLLGYGTYGTVYLIRHREMPELEAAVKVIPVPPDPREVDALRRDGFSEAEIIAYIDRVVTGWREEILLMKKYQGRSHFVSIEDCKIVLSPDGGPEQWILIRMEKLKSLSAYAAEETLTEEQVIDLGCQICEALAKCHADGVLHRDIKPDNIFVNDQDSDSVLFKLGDFGVAGWVRPDGTGSVKGAPNYVAPEVIRGERYDQRADIYSLGLTLYRLLNGGRLPFLPERKLLTPEDYAVALRVRLSGAELPPAKSASSAMNSVLSWACAFDQRNRVCTAKGLSDALRAVKLGKRPFGVRLRLRPPRPLLWVGLGMLIAALIWGAVCLVRRRGADEALPAPTPIPMINVVGG